MSKIWTRVRNWYGAQRQYEELDEELALHREMRARKLRDAGMPEADVRRSTSAPGKGHDLFAVSERIPSEAHRNALPSSAIYPDSQVRI